jgi:cell filamentation protein
VSRNNQLTDPYLYPNSSVLINKFGLKNQDALQEVEGFIFGLKNQEELSHGNFDYAHLQAIHHHFFGDVYEWAGKERTVDIAKGNSYFCHKQYISKELDKLFSKLKADNYLRELPLNDFCKKLSFYFNEINAAHPFREGNGRVQRAFCDALAKQAGYVLDWTRVNTEKYLQASIAGFLHSNYDLMESILKDITIRNHVLTLKYETLELEENIIQLLKEYVNKQIELTTNIERKKTSILSNKSELKDISQHILILHNETKKLATELSNAPIAKQLLNQSQPVPLQKLGGFLEIHARFQKNEIASSDVCSILRYAKNTITISQNLNQKNSRTK